MGEHMRKMSFGYHKFEDAPETTEECRRIESIGFLVAAVICGGLILGAVIFFAKGSVFGGVVCIVAMLELLLFWVHTLQQTILPEFGKKAEKERIALYAARLRQAGEDPLDPQICEKNRLRDELNGLLDQETLDQDEFRRIGELMELLEAMGETVDAPQNLRA